MINYMSVRRIKNIVIVLLVVASTASCSILRQNDSKIESPYIQTSYLIDGAYTSFYNDSLKISEDLYAIYNPDYRGYSILSGEFRGDRNIIKKTLGIKLSPDDFVLQLKSKAGDLTTSLYYISGKSIQNKALKDFSHKKMLFNIYTFSVRGDQIIQIFKVKEDYKNNKRNYSYYLRECDAIVQRLCYGDYYKKAYWNGSKIMIDLSESRYSENKQSIEDVLSDTLFIKDKSNKLVSIPSNRKNLVIDFRLSEKAKALINSENKLTESDNGLQFSLYNKKVLTRNGKNSAPLMSKEIKEGTFSLTLEKSYDDYLLLVHDKQQNVYEALFINIW